MSMPKLTRNVLIDVQPSTAKLLLHFSEALNLNRLSRSNTQIDLIEWKTSMCFPNSKSLVVAYMICPIESFNVATTT